MNTLSAVSKVSTKSFQKKTEQLKKAKQLGTKVVHAFAHFINYEWMFETNLMNHMM